MKTHRHAMGGKTAIHFFRSPGGHVPGLNPAVSRSLACKFSSLKGRALGALLLLICATACDKSPRVPANPPQSAPPPVVAAPPKPELQNTTLAISPAATAGDPAAAPERASQVAVLGYHRFVSKVRHPDTEITLQEFETQMKALKDHGIAVVSMGDYLAWKAGKKNLPPRSALITIDDGYKSAYTEAWPILKKYGYPFTMFVYLDYIRGGPKSGGESLSWEQLAEMRDAGVSIQSHTVSHRDLRGKRHTAQGPEYEQFLWRELHDSKAQIEQRLGVKVEALALPYGFFNQQVKEMAAKAGYEAIFTVNGQLIDRTAPANAAGRFMIDSSKPKIFTASLAFPATLGGAGAEGAARLVKASRTVPAEGQLVHTPNPLIEVNLADLGDMGALDPASVSMRISGIGVVPARFDASKGTVSFQGRLPAGSPYTVIVSAKAGSQRIEMRWNFSIAPVGAAPAATPGPTASNP